MGCVAACQSAAAGFTQISASDQNASMHRGMNVMDGGPVWDRSAPAWFRPVQFDLLRDAGFDTVRINLHAFPHLDAAGKIDASWFATLDRYVHAALGDGLIVVLDVHDDIACDQDVAACRSKLLLVWSQIASRFKDEASKLLFDPLNEPHGAVTAQVWNGLLRDTLKAIRATNPSRHVVIGPAGYNSVSCRAIADARSSRKRYAHHRHGSLLLAHAVHPSGCALATGLSVSFRDHLRLGRTEDKDRTRFRSGRDLGQGAQEADLSSASSALTKKVTWIRA